MLIVVDVGAGRERVWLLLSTEHSRLARRGCVMMTLVNNGAAVSGRRACEQRGQAQPAASVSRADLPDCASSNPPPVARRLSDAAGRRHNHPLRGMPQATAFIPAQRVVCICFHHHKAGANGDDPVCPANTTRLATSRLDSRVLRCTHWLLQMWTLQPSHRTIRPFPDSAASFHLLAMPAVVLHGKPWARAVLSQHNVSSWCAQVRRGRRRLIHRCSLLPLLLITALSMPEHTTLEQCALTVSACSPVLLPSSLCTWAVLHITTDSSAATTLSTTTTQAC
jgi:hypothetical protein